MSFNRLQISMPKINDLEPAVLLLLRPLVLFPTLVLSVLTTFISITILAVSTDLRLPVAVLLQAVVLFFTAILLVTISEPTTECMTAAMSVIRHLCCAAVGFS